MWQALEWHSLDWWNDSFHVRGQRANNRHTAPVPVNCHVLPHGLFISRKKLIAFCVQMISSPPISPIHVRIWPVHWRRMPSYETEFIIHLCLFMWHMRRKFRKVIAIYFCCYHKIDNEYDIMYDFASMQIKSHFAVTLKHLVIDTPHFGQIRWIKTNPRPPDKLSVLVWPFSAIHQ